MKPCLRILLTDDHDLMRFGTRRFLETTFPGTVVEEARNARETLELVRQRRWDLLLLDLGLPDKHGLDILRDLKQARPELRVLVLSATGEDEFAVPALNAGADGFVAKTEAIRDLPQAMEKVMAGGKYLSLELADKLASRFLSKSVGLPHESLSERELQVLRLLATGRSATAISVTLSLSVKTVSTYRARLLEKMNLHSNAELIRYALDHRLVE